VPSAPSVAAVVPAFAWRQRRCLRTGGVCGRLQCSAHPLVDASGLSLRSGNGDSPWPPARRRMPTVNLEAPRGHELRDSDLCTRSRGRQPAQPPAPRPRASSAPTVSDWRSHAAPNPQAAMASARAAGSRVARRPQPCCPVRRPDPAAADGPAWPLCSAPRWLLAGPGDGIRGRWARPQPARQRRGLPWLQAACPEAKRLDRRENRSCIG